MNTKGQLSIMYEGIPAVAALNRVPGFDPSGLLRKTVSPENGKEILKLDLHYKKLWFRLANPRGRIRLKPLSITEQMAVFEAQVYLDCSDTNPVSSFVSGCAKEAAPGGNYVQAAQFAALDEALSDAGFGVQFADLAMGSSGCGKISPDGVVAGGQGGSAVGKIKEAVHTNAMQIQNSGRIQRALETQNTVSAQKSALTQEVARTQRAAGEQNVVSAQKTSLAQNSVPDHETLPVQNTAVVQNAFTAKNIHPVRNVNLDQKAARGGKPVNSGVLPASNGQVTGGGKLSGEAVDNIRGADVSVQETPRAAAKLASSAPQGAAVQKNGQARQTVVNGTVVQPMAVAHSQRVGTARAFHPVLAKGQKVQPGDRGTPERGKPEDKEVSPNVSFRAENMAATADRLPADTEEQQSLPVRPGALEMSGAGKETSFAVTPESNSVSARTADHGTLPVANGSGAGQLKDSIQGAMALLGGQELPAGAADIPAGQGQPDMISRQMPVYADVSQRENGARYTSDMPVNEIVKLMTLEEAGEVIVDTGVCKGQTIAQVAERRPPSLKFYVCGGYKGSNNILRAAAQLMLDSMESQEAA